MREYETEQRRRLLSFLREHLDRHFTVEELAENISGVSLSTLYRNINQMVEEGAVRRFQEEGRRKFLYQYVGAEECSGHLHLKCNKCGRILHMNEKAVMAVMDALMDNLDFELDRGATILFGECVSCK